MKKSKHLAYFFCRLVDQKLNVVFFLKKELNIRVEKSKALETV